MYNRWRHIIRDMCDRNYKVMILRFAMDTSDNKVTIFRSVRATTIEISD